MPVTPFHFGPGLLLKAAARGRLSLTAFVAANVVIDVESGVNLLAGRTPVHATLHTLGVAMLAGLAVGALVHVAGRRLGARKASSWARGPALLGGWLGGVTHVLLDGVMHPDIRPFLPLTAANPLLGAVDLGTLHLFCLATGLLGLALLAVRRSGQR